MDGRLTRRTLLGAAWATGMFGVDVPFSGEQPRRGGILKYGMESPPMGLDPHAGPGAELHGMTYSRLVVLNDDWTGVDPDLALRWEVSPDGRTYTFHLRPNVRFHDGSLMTAGDAVFSFERILSEETGAFVGGLLSGVVERVTSPNQATIQFLVGHQIFRHLQSQDPNRPVAH